MKLLFDQNLSYRLITALAELYPGSLHVKSVGLDSSGDDVIWNYAKTNGCLIISKDSDFHQRSFVLQDPPKVVWIRRGNCSTGTIDQLLRENFQAISNFVVDKDATLLVIE